MTTHDIAVNGVRLRVTDWGGSSAVVLFSHPTGFLGMIWRPVIERLRARGLSARLITYDHRGHGLSSKPDSGYEWSNFVGDTLALLDDLGVRDIVGVGHSAGATTLACVAAKRPELVARLVLIDPILVDPSRPAAGRETRNVMAAKTRTRRLVWQSKEELFDSLRRRSPYDTWTDEALLAYVEHGTFVRPDGECELLCPGRIEAQVYENAASIDAFACLTTVRAPTLILRGELSDAFDEPRAKRAVRCMAGGRLVTVSGATHYLPMEKPDIVADVVLAECSGRGYTGRS
jgi:pimeloyl-ACP methyl ester carboxylesterase